MTLNNIKLTREKYDIIAKNRGIKEPEKMSTKKLWKTLSRYDSKLKTYSTHIKFINLNLKKNGRKQNISKRDLHKKS